VSSFRASEEVRHRRLGLEDDEYMMNKERRRGLVTGEVDGCNRLALEIDAWSSRCCVEEVRRGLVACGMPSPSAWRGTKD
jgi:hypothetical protein